MVAVSLALLLSTGQMGPSLSPAAQESFKAWFTKGESLYAAGEYGAAIHAFLQADRIKTTPEVAFDLAKTHEKLGDEAFATFYYRQYLRRAPTAGDALEVAEILGDALAKAEQDGRGLLEVDGSEAATITVNGESYPELPVAVFLAPGDYDVVAYFGTTQVKRSASIVGGRVTSVQMDRVSPPLLAVSAEPVTTSWSAAPSDATEVPTDVKKSGPTNTRAILHTTSYGLIGVGTAAVLSGMVFGMMSSGDRAKLTSDRASMTATEGRQLTASAASKAGTANLLLGVGVGTALAGGLMFAFTLPEPGMKEGGASP